MIELKYTRRDYMDKKCDHNTYYAQFVTRGLKATVNIALGDKIVVSKDPHFNDIPLRQWDRLAGHIPSLQDGILSALGKSNATTCAAHVTNGGVSDADKVSVLKAAARQIKEEYDEPEPTE